ncbi:MAG: hypothetical protein RIQ81_860 [Pseudomonadota bacterium]
MSGRRQQKSVLIIGAGYLGKAVASEAAAAGWRVVGARRNAPDGSSPVPGFSAWLSMDVLKIDDLRTAIDSFAHSFDAVVYCVSAGTPSVDAYRDAYQHGLANVISILPATARLVFVSSTGVYPEDDGRWVDEFHQIDEESVAPTQRAMLAGEQFVNERSNSLVLRFSGIYGPGRTRMLNVARDAQDPMTVREIAYTNRIHVEDGARAVVHCLELQNPARTYCVTDSDPAPQHEIIVWLRQQLGLKPLSVVFTGPDGMPLAHKDLPETNKRVRNGLLASTGFSWKFPGYRDGYGSLVTSNDRGASHV